VTSTPKSYCAKIRYIILPTSSLWVVLFLLLNRRELVLWVRLVFEIRHACAHAHELFIQLLYHVVCGLKVHNSVWVIDGKALPGEVSLDSSSYLRI